MYEEPWSYSCCDLRMIDVCHLVEVVTNGEVTGQKIGPRRSGWRKDFFSRRKSPLAEGEQKRRMLKGQTIFYFPRTLYNFGDRPTKSPISSALMSFQYHRGLNRGLLRPMIAKTAFFPFSDQKIFFLRGTRLMDIRPVRSAEKKNSNHPRTLHSVAVTFFPPPLLPPFFLLWNSIAIVRICCK